MMKDSKARSAGLLALLALVGCATAQTTTVQTPTDPCVGASDGFLAHPTDCTKYFSCYGGMGYEQSCPDGKYFDPTRTLCDVKENVECVVNNCPPNDIVYLPIPGVCDRFTICIGGNAFESSCDEGLYFDEVLQECNLKNETNCVVNPCVQPPPDPPILEMHPNDANCAQYVICLNGEPIVRDCAPNLFFDPNVSQCVQADDCITFTCGTK
uniref:Chitin-binding type-2 domain-containing protein n=1 Tax=Anopheles dirus TaxID=7168 RepID=A0A182NDG0_9DIPT